MSLCSVAGSYRSSSSSCSSRKSRMLLEGDGLSPSRSSFGRDIFGSGNSGRGRMVLDCAHQELMQKSKSNRPAPSHPLEKEIWR